MSMPTVRKIAREISKKHILSRAERKEMFSSISKEILDTRLRDGNLNEMMERIDEIRFSKEKELVFLLGLQTQNTSPRTLDSVFFNRIINFPPSESLDSYRKEIHFLLSVAAVIIHL